jgi:hypothetical protein
MSLITSLAKAGASGSFFIFPRPYTYARDNADASCDGAQLLKPKTATEPFIFAANETIVEIDVVGDEHPVAHEPHKAVRDFGEYRRVRKPSRGWAPIASTHGAGHLRTNCSPPIKPERTVWHRANASSPTVSASEISDVRAPLVSGEPPSPSSQSNVSSNLADRCGSRPWASNIWATGRCSGRTKTRYAVVAIMKFHSCGSDGCPPNDPVTAYHHPAAPCARIKHLVTCRSQ